MYCGEYMWVHTHIHDLVGVHGILYAKQHCVVCRPTGVVGVHLCYHLLELKVSLGLT